jgi:hypothetical protein
MKNLYQAETVNEVKNRLDHLQMNSERQWGKMTPAQAMAHCAASMEMATGEWKPSRMFAGRIFGPFVKKIALKENQPLGKNAPTMPELRIRDDRDLAKERRRLSAVIDRFAAAGSRGCTDHPHSFFGRMTPDQWATLMYKHLDHHLRQFGV